MPFKIFSKLTVVWLTAAILATGSVLFHSTPAEAASLTGTWVGSGTMTINSKGTERVRCRVSYSRRSGQTFTMNARCASGAGRLSQSGTLSRIAGNKFQGSVYNAKFGVSASVYVTIQGRRQTVHISSAGGSGRFSLRRR